jgi:hypothetical protein
MKKKIFFFASLKSMKKSYPDPLVRGTDPIWIQIRIKMSRIPSTDFKLAGICVLAVLKIMAVDRISTPSQQTKFFFIWDRKVST